MMMWNFTLIIRVFILLLFVFVLGQVEGQSFIKIFLVLMLVSQLFLVNWLVELAKRRHSVAWLMGIAGLGYLVLGLLSTFGVAPPFLPANTQLPLLANAVLLLFLVSRV